MSQTRQIGVAVLAGLLAAWGLGAAIGVDEGVANLAALAMLCIPLAVILNQLFSVAAAKGRR